MKTFEIRDRIVDLDSGDTGVITRAVEPGEEGCHEPAWWVLWESGDCIGEELWVAETAIELESEYADTCAAVKTLEGLRPLLDEVSRRADKMDGGVDSFTVTIDPVMWEQIKNFL